MTRFHIVFVGLILLLSSVGLAQTGTPKAKSRATRGDESKASPAETVSQLILDKLVAREKELAAAEQRHAAAVIDEALADDFHELGSDGTLYAKADLLPMLKDVKIDDYTLSDFKSFPLNKDCVILTYNSIVKGDYKGQAFPSKVAISSLWVHRHGSWQIAFHQVTPVAEPKQGQSE